METALVVAPVLAFFAAVLVFIVVRRLVKWAFRLALITALVVAVLIGAGVLWWRGAFDDEKPARRPAATRSTAR